jgi:hypothetical protein
MTYNQQFLLSGSRWLLKFFCWEPRSRIASPLDRSNH